MKSYQDFIGSFSFDQRLASYDIEGSIAHVKMLVACRIISSADGKKIIKGLESIAADLKKGKPLPREEDIHYAVERELIRRIGPTGGKMHTARSRNDQVALDLRLYLRDEANKVRQLLDDMQKALVGQAERGISAVMPGYTHLQPAQPVLFSHHILSYAWMFQRDRERLKDCCKRIAVLPLGSAALAGTSFPIDRAYVARLLGFPVVGENSIDGVSDRDFALEFLSMLSLISLHLSRLCEELIVWSSVEFGFVTLADDFTSGSSIMPQKRNPDVAEIIRGKTGRVYGNLFALLTIMKGIPLAYNRDMQEDKPPVFDAVDTAKGCLETAAAMVSSMTIHPERMNQATGKGFLQATEVADYLTRKGLPFRQAHGIVHDMVDYCIKQQKTLQDLTRNELKRFSPCFTDDIASLLIPCKIVERKSSYGGTSSASVRRQIQKLKKVLSA